MSLHTVHSVCACVCLTSDGTYATNRQAIAIQSIRSTSNVCIVRETIPNKNKYINLCTVQ